MIASVEFLSTVVSMALLVAVMSPIVLMILLVMDWRGGRQW